MAGPILSESDLRRAVALVIAHHDAGRPLTAVLLGDAMGLSSESGRIRSRRLVERGRIEVTADARGVNHLTPTPAARILDLPRVVIRAAPAKHRRPCMGCHEAFVSDGHHHRHCNRCRESLARLSAGGCYAF